MTAHPKHSSLGTWVGLGVGLALAWGGWQLWQWWQRAQSPWLYDLELATPPALLTPWYHRWSEDPGIFIALAILALLCAVAGAMIGRRGVTETA